MTKQPIQLDPREMLGFKLDAATLDGAKMGAKNGDKNEKIAVGGQVRLGAKQGNKGGEKQTVRAGAKLGAKTGHKDA